MKLIYLEPDEEITSAIERIAKVSDYRLAIVAPKNGTLFQSLVNLKLLAKEAKRLGKEIALISTDKIGTRLAKQVGLPTYQSTGNLTESRPRPVDLKAPGQTSESLPEGIRVNRYIPPTPGGAGQDLESTDSGPTAEPLAAPDRPIEPEPEEDQPMAESSNDPADKGEDREPEANRQLGVGSEPNELQPSAPFKPISQAPLPPIVSHEPLETLERRSKLVIPWKSLGVAGGILIVGLVILYLFFPKAKLTLTFVAKPINQTLNLNIKTVPDEEETTLTGNLLAAEKTLTKTIIATGKKDIGSRATGKITVTNKYRDSSGVGKDQSFAAGTIVTDSKTKKTFTVNKSVSVGRVTYDPNSGSAIYQNQSVEVTATEPGESYNIPAGSFAITGGLDNTEVSSSVAFVGGLTKQVTILSQEDADKALSELKTQAQAEGLAELKTKAQTQTLLEEAVGQTVKQQAVDKEIGSETDGATVKVVNESIIIVFDLALAEEKLHAALERQLKPDQQLEIPEGAKPVLKFKSADRSMMTVEVSGQGFGAPKYNKIEVAKLVTNQPADRARTFLMDKYQAKEVKVEITPLWWPRRLPALYNAIMVEYDFQPEIPTS